jgi:hypothetical protein
MPEPIPDDSVLADLLSQGATAAEQFQRDMIDIDSQWRSGTLDDWLQNQLDQLRGSVDDGNDRPSNHAE